MDIKSLSSRQVRWAQELSRYYFQIDYQQGKANRAANALSRFPQRSLNEEKKLWAKNTQIFYCLQSFFTRASLLGFSTSAKLSLFHQVFICYTHVLPQLRHFWDTFQTKLADKNLYTASIGGMKLKLVELQESNKKVQKLRAIKELQESWTDINGILHYQELPFVSESRQPSGRILWYW